ncbi:iron-sulfur cluster assembly scaffold protein [Candidatus Falkowbacteria bacterium RIFOXYD2_FULL_35_9]|uniref:Iron-sulfur cluster assembly scaffold protein n=1 Tax=Candidatus Falkowbacteria bacterium RIFOXYC2_FULL_36_12 TaxID=1798002 RepID=A0A1F5SYR3_9BACT|nr:MAG: iron-sulfur cluster assembly scaffold protein [Candidatus Falkowbacteria bacterium RIFOXYB2_FULL_35_7]OGF31840.1 MAG: iron-sulfur cluster assembly scaffold protein [Candidatus Falkowbacteria bacterium RIFOXYC2_FULL_36_12]OGF34637.1 MAG: iron-sulfur cluster assembly scaffold protein [Candidatus Falkowbacteria bacterium RIFOXYA2_FULL_35_8]OGF45732.1 MAG: iron-sulfur cluster assembly scaffold protein [Candidatus Falkowbacteria bacterium RIFOXYD2_FULL_35_9]
MQYTEKLIEHFKNPHNQGDIKDADAVGEVGNMKCGDIMKVYLKINNDKIDDIKFETLGCAAAIATSSVLTDLAKGKSLDDALKISKQDIVDVLGGIPAPKFHCSILAEEALKKAIENYKK